MSRKKAPAFPQKGKVVEVDIEALAARGEGRASWDGLPVYIPLAVPGERLLARVTEVRRSHARAEVVRVLEAAPDRAVPPCPVYEACGGCQLQHLVYPAQRAYKRRLVEEAFEGEGLGHVPVKAVIGMEEPWRYRHKIQFPIGTVGGQVVAGFYGAGTHDIVDVASCVVQHAAGDAVMNTVRFEAARLGISPYNEESYTGVLRHVLVRVGRGTGEVLVVLVTNGPRLPHAEALVAALEARVEGLVGVVQNVNAARTNVVLGDEEVVLAGRGYLEETLLGLSFRLSPRSFFQVNPQQTEVLYEQAFAYAAMTGDETVVDLYCGIGTLSLFLARRAARVVGVEVVPEAIDDARANAVRNGVSNASFRCGDAAEELVRLAAEGLRPGLVVFDPPRRGCDAAVLDAAAALAPTRMVYVSCNPVTLARDVAHLRRSGYHPVEVQPVDLFPHTAHVEAVALLEKG